MQQLALCDHHTLPLRCADRRRARGPQVGLSQWHMGTYLTQGSWKHPHTGAVVVHAATNSSAGSSERHSALDRHGRRSSGFIGPVPDSVSKLGHVRPASCLSPTQGRLCLGVQGGGHAAGDPGPSCGRPLGEGVWCWAGCAWRRRRRQHRRLRDRRCITHLAIPSSRSGRRHCLVHQRMPNSLQAHVQPRLCATFHVHLWRQAGSCRHDAFETAGTWACRSDSWHVLQGGTQSRPAALHGSLFGCAAHLHAPTRLRLPSSQECGVRVPQSERATSCSTSKT